MAGEARCTICDERAAETDNLSFGLFCRPCNSNVFDNGSVVVVLAALRLVGAVVLFLAWYWLLWAASL